MHPEATLADLYDPDLMPPDLRRAHQELDQAVDRCTSGQDLIQSASALNICSPI